MTLTTTQRAERSAQLGILVNDEDAWLLSAFTWKLIQGNPATTSLDREWTIYIQHFIIGMPIDASLVVDHRDQNKLNNHRSNLHYVTKQQNMLNHKNKDDPMANIRLLKGGRYWFRLNRMGWNYYAPTSYATLEEAQQARDAMMKELGG